MQSMKVNGHAEVSAALARVRRLRALGRVGRDDSHYIEDNLELALVRIVEMIETDQHGDPIGGEV